MWPEIQSTKQSNYHFIFLSNPQWWEILKPTWGLCSSCTIVSSPPLLTWPRNIRYCHNILPIYEFKLFAILKIASSTIIKPSIELSYIIITRFIRFRSATPIKPWFELSKESFYLVCPSNFPILTLHILKSSWNPFLPHPKYGHQTAVSF